MTLGYIAFTKLLRKKKLGKKKHRKSLKYNDSIKPYHCIKRKMYEEDEGGKTVCKKQKKKK